MKMVRGMVIALPQNEQVKIGPLVKLNPLHYSLDQTWPLLLHVHSLGWPLPGITCFFQNIGQQKHEKKNLCKSAFYLIRSLFVVPLCTVQLAQCITIQRADFSTPQNMGLQAHQESIVKPALKEYSVISIKWLDNLFDFLPVA